MFNAAKDAITSRAAQSWINDQISRYGRISDLRIDSQRKNVSVTVQLEGETSPVTLTVGRYQVETEGGRTFVRASDFDCSRIWLKHALNDHATGRRFEVPALAASAL